MNYFVNEDELISFMYRGTSSAFFSLYVLEVQNLHNAFERDIEFIEVPGRDGDLIIDNLRKKSKEITIEAFIDLDEAYTSSFTELCEDIERWLQGTVGVSTLNFSDSPRNYKAICTGVEITETIEGLGEVNVTFLIQP